MGDSLRFGRLPSDRQTPERHTGPAVERSRIRDSPKGPRHDGNIRINAEHAAAGKPAYSLKSVPQGAATSVWAGVVAPADVVGGRYCENCHVAQRLEGDTFSAVSEGVRPYALDPAHAKALWAKSEKMVGETF
jgi:hypothetical protein